MIYAAPGETREAVTQLATGLAGTVGFRIRDNQGADTTARTTASIVEDIAGSGIYRHTFTAPATAGQYTIVWDDGDATFNIEPLVVSVTPSVLASGDTFASTDELAARLGITLDTNEESRAATLLALATGIIQTETGQTISLVTDDELSRPGAYNDRLRLPQRPVVSVASVALDGTTLDPDGWYVDADEIVRTNLVGVIADNRFGGYNVGFGFPAQTLTVVYTHGYSEIPAVVKGVCMEMVARCFTNPGAVIQESIGNEATTYAPYSAPATGLLMTDAEKRAVNDVLRRTSGSVTLR